VQGCDAGPAAQAEPGTGHAVTFAEARSVYQSYLTTSDASARAGDATAGLANVADGEWEIANAQYTALTSTGTAVPRYQYGTPDFYVPAQTGYPRWFMVSVPRRALGAPAPVSTLMVFGRNKAGASWTLDGTTALAPGQQLPAISRGSDGYAVALSTHDQSLLLPPDVVGATQAAVVDDGPASPAAAVVAPGESTTALYAQQSAYSNGQTAKGLEYTWLMLGASFPQFALRTTDGGALVLYGMFLDTTTEHPHLVISTAIPVPPDFTPLLAAPTEVGYHAVFANWTYQFVAIDPPATARNAKLQVIAGTGVPTSGHAY